MVLEHLELTESKTQKWSTISRWKGDCQFLFLGNTMACKWMYNWWVLLLSSALEGMNVILSVQMRKKGSKIKFWVPCPKVVKLYNSGIGEVDLLDQLNSPYCLEQNSSVSFYLRIFFDLMHIAFVDSYSFITWSTLTNCLSLITRLLTQKTWFNIPSRPEKEQYKCRDHLRGRTKLNRLIIMEDIYKITKRCGKDACTVQWRVKKIEHLLSV